MAELWPRIVTCVFTSALKDLTCFTPGLGRPGPAHQAPSACYTQYYSIFLCGFSVYRISIHITLCLWNDMLTFHQLMGVDGMVCHSLLQDVSTCIVMITLLIQISRTGKPRAAVSPHTCSYTKWSCDAYRNWITAVLPLYSGLDL